MDPLTLGIGVIGLGMQLFGGLSSASDAKQTAALQQQTARQMQGLQTDIAGYENQANDQRRQQMELEGRRGQLEQFRNMQRVRAQGLNAATQQGAQFGSGLAGGQAQATDQGLFNVSGINQNLEIGRNMFGLDAQISQKKLAISNLQTNSNIQMSGLQSDQAMYQGLSQFGSSLTKSAGTISNIFGGGGSQGVGYFAGGGMNGAPPTWR